MVLFAVLRAWGVPAAFLRLPGPDAPDLDPQFPSPAGLDQLWVVTRDGAGETLLLNPACTTCAPGQIGDGDGARTGLLVAPPSSGFEPAEFTQGPYAAGAVTSLAGAAVTPPRT